MNLLETLLSAGGGKGIAEIAKTLNLDIGDATNVLKQLAPALGRGISRNTAEPSGLDALMGALTKGKHERYIDNPASVTRPEAVEDGNGILGHIFGSKEVSRNVAKHASKQTGVSDSLIKKMLPMLATLAMGALAKQKTAQPQFSDRNQAGAAGGLLNTFLDADKDGSIMDDLLGMAGKFLR